MTEERLVLADLLEKAGEGDFRRAVAEAVLQLLMESDVEGMIGAARSGVAGGSWERQNSAQRRTEQDAEEGNPPQHIIVMDVTDQQRRDDTDYVESTPLEPIGRPRNNHERHPGHQ